MNRIIAVDFDGTLCANKYPKIGRPNLGLIKDLKHRQEQGDKLILWTCRTGKELEEAVYWCISQHDLYFDEVNRNLPESIEMFDGSDTRKIFAHEYYDDRAKEVKGFAF